MKNLFTLSLICLGLSAANVSVYAETEEKELQTIYITAPSKFRESSRAAATSVTILTEEDIEASGQASLPELLRMTTGIGVTNQGGAGKLTALRIRGEESYRTHVYIDGVKVADPTAVQVSPRLEHIQLKGIERIEVLRGVQGFSYGADAGGIINIVTRRGLGDLEVNYTQARGSYNETNTGIELSAGNAKGDFYISTNNIKTDGFNALQSDNSNDNDGYENTTFHSKLGISADEHTRFQFVLNRVLADNEYDDCFGSNDCREKFIQSTQKISGDFESDQFQHHIGMANTEITRSYFADDSLTFEPEGDIKKLEYNGLYENNNFDIIYGADSEKQTSKNNFSPVAVRYSNVGQFLEYKDNHVNDLFLNLGVRNDRSSNYGEHVSSRLSFAYIIPVAEHEFKLRASSGNGFRAPSLNEVTSSGGQPLTEETTKGHDIGFDWLFRNGTLIQFTHFDQSVTDEIVYNNSTFTYEQVKGESTSKGVEVSSKVPVGTYWAVVANYTYNDTNDRDGNQRVRRPEHSGNLGFRYTGEKLKSSLNFRGARGAVDLGNEALDNYIIANIGLNYQLDKKVSFFGTVNNLFDKEYEESVGYNTADRSFNIGTQISF